MPYETYIAMRQFKVAGMGGARSAVIVYPDRQLAVVVLTNLVGTNAQQCIPDIAALQGPVAINLADRPSPAGPPR